MTPPKKPSDPSWLLSHAPAAAADATRVKNGPPDLTRLARSIGRVTPGNRPLPEATVQSAHQPLYDKAMNTVADMIPVLGSLRGLRAGHEQAQSGSPLMGAATAALSIMPEIGGATSKGLKLLGRELPEVAQFAKVKPEEFHAALSQFAEARPSEAGYITWRTPREMRKEKMQTFLSADGKTGYAIHPETGDIRNVFNHGEPGLGAHAVADAVANRGGKVLDAFDSGLGNFYRDHGFTETDRMPWNNEYRPANWDEAKHGTPDVIAMQHPMAGQGRSAAELLADYSDRRGARKALAYADRPIDPVRVGENADPQTAANRSTIDRMIARADQQIARMKARGVPTAGDVPAPSKPAAAAPNPIEAPWIQTHADRWKPTQRGVFERRPGDADYREPAPLPFDIPTGRAKPHPIARMISDDPRVERRIRDDVLKGLPLGGESWYGLAPVRRSFDEMGGPISFKDFNMAGAAGSARTPTHNELTNASINLFAKRNQIPFEDARQEFLKRFPQSMRPTYMGMHGDIFQRGLDRGMMGPASPNDGALKIPHYFHDRMLGGNGVALDTHERRAMAQALGLTEEQVGGALDRNAASYTAGTEPYLRVAQKLGLHPDQVQASRWLGGGLQTGLKSQPKGDFIQTLEDGLLYSARTRGLDESPQGLRSLWGRIAQGQDFFMPYSGDGGFPVYR